MRGRKSTRNHTVASQLFGATVFLACILTFSLIAAQSLYSQLNQPRQAQKISERAHRIQESGTDYAGWLQVGGTNISLPLVQAHEDDDTAWFLSHDPEGKPSRLGSAFIDSRCNLESQHIMIFAHNSWTTNSMFSPIAECWKQDRFDSLQAAMVRTKDGREITFRPLCSLRVDKSYADIQHFRFESDHDYSAWISKLLQDARSMGAVRGSPETMRATTDQALSLVTCSNKVPGRPERTIVLFIRQDTEVAKGGYS